MKFKIVSLGCKVNSYECNSIAKTLLEKGYVETKDNDYDVAIVNTCSVTATADQKSRQKIRSLKKNNENSIICVMGCYSQKQHDFIRDEIKADIIIGTSKRKELPLYIERFLKDRKQIDETESQPRFFNYEELGISAYSENVRAYLKIQDGCDNFCSYCLIPFVRGRSRSRKVEDIINEAKHLIESGYKEIVLTGIHVGGFGQDLEDYSFSKLVRTLSDLEGLESLRISSIEESEIDDELIDLVTSRKNIAKHLHIPVQSGSEEILKLMNRKYDKNAFINTIKKIREKCPDICLTTDIIVGFPGESEKHFEETVEFLKECTFNMLHVFPFSAREGTKAKLMKDQISPEVKDRRKHILLKLSDEMWDEYTSKFDGKELEILVEEYDDKGIAKGRATNYIDFSFPYPVNCVSKRIKVIYKK